MQYVRLGDTGLEVSGLCLGTMTFGSPAWCARVLDEGERARLEEPYQPRQGRGYI